jgi:hypothetical protein
MARSIVRRLVVLSIPALLAGCAAKAPPPEKRVEVSNVGFQLDQLFTDARGYTVYRFYDKGEYRYYVVGPDGGAQMLPTTKTVHDPEPYYDPGLGIGVGVGTGGHRHR